jgi:hypothetical protein
MEQIAYCGIDCCKCPAFRATIDNDDTLREKTAKLFSTGRVLLKKEDIHCYGCHSDYTLTKLCRLCKIKACAEMKEVNTCAECENYPCWKIEEFCPVGSAHRDQLDSMIPWRSK